MFTKTDDVDVAEGDRDFHNTIFGQNTNKRNSRGVLEEDNDFPNVKQASDSVCAFVISTV